MTWNLPLSKAMKPFIQFLVRLLLCLMCLPHISQAIAAEPEPVYDVLFLDAFLDKNSLDIPLEAVTSDFEQFYLPLEELAFLLELALVIHPDTFAVNGWFISEDTPVILDFKTKQYQVGNKKGDITSSQWLVEDDMLHLSTDAVADWFGISSEIKVNTLKVNFTSEQLLPQQAKLARKKEREKFDRSRGRSKTASLVEDNYQWFTLPMLDMNSRYGFTAKDDKHNSDTSYAITGSGDIAHHGSEFAFNKTPGQQQLRLKLHKQTRISDRDWYYEVGDLSGLGRGFSWGTRRNANQRFGHHRFEGNAQPGWEAELYRNDSLIDYLEVGADGTYLFDNVPIQLGQNQFKIVLYGPQGKQQIIEESFTGHQLNQTVGQWTPTMSVGQPKKRLMPLDFDQSNGHTLNTNLSYGISDQLQASLGWNKVQTSDVNNSNSHQYLNAALTGVWQSTVFNLTSSLNPDSDSLSYTADFQSHLWQHDWNFNVQNNYDNNNQPVKSMNLSLLGNKSLFSERDNYAIALSQDISADSRSIGLTTQYSANFDVISLNNRWSVLKEQDLTTANGSTGFSSRFGEHQFRFDSQYTLWPKQKLQSFTASYSRRFNSTFLQLRSNIRPTDENSDISAQLSWNFKRFRLGARLLVDEQRNINAALTFSMALGVSPKGVHYSRDSLQRTATIKAMAFMDDNNNGVFDQNEAPVSGVSFKGNSLWTDKTTDETGVVYLPGAKTATAQYLEFKSDSLDDPFLAVDQTRFSVQTHAGGVNLLYFPVYQTTEIEGEISLQKLSGGDVKAQAAVPLLLLDRKGNTVKRILSEYDGFFIFDGVKPGEYRIVVEDKYLQRKGYRFDQAVEVNASTIDPDGDTLAVGRLLITDIEVSKQ